MLLSQSSHIKKRTTTDRTELEEQQELDDAAHERLVRGHAQAKVDNSTSLDLGCDIHAANDGAASDTKSEIAAPTVSDEVTKVTLTNVRKAHNAFDRTRRDWEALATGSSEHANTQGSKVERDLVEMIAYGKTLDADLCAMEQIALRGERYTADQIEAAARTASRLSALLKGGQKKANALRLLMKLD